MKIEFDNSSGDWKVTVNGQPQDYNCLTVVLEKDLTDDDARRILEAIKCLRGVLSVTPHVSDPVEPVGSKKLTIHEVAQRFRVHQQTVYNWVYSGKLPCERYGHRTLRFLEADLVKFEQAHEIGAPMRSLILEHTKRLPSLNRLK